MRTVSQRAGRDAPVSRAIGCCCAEQRCAIGVIQLDGCPRFSAAASHGRRCVAGDVVGIANARIRARSHVQTRWRCRCRGVQGVGLAAGVSTGDGLGACVDDARATVFQVQTQRAIARQGVDGDCVSSAAASDAGNRPASRACGRQYKVADIYASDRLVVGDRVIHAGGIGQGRGTRTVDAGHRWACGYCDGELSIREVTCCIGGANANVVRASSQIAAASLEVCARDREAAIVGVA